MRDGLRLAKKIKKAFGIPRKQRVHAMKILSVNVSQPTTVAYRGRSVTTGIFKSPVAGRAASGVFDPAASHLPAISFSS
jgi:hypothetical protein